MNILGIDPGPHALGWCTIYDGGHQFGELDLREEWALADLRAKIAWADAVYCESYRPREFLQGDGPKTAEVIGQIQAMCQGRNVRLVMVDHATWRAWASTIAAHLAFDPEQQAPDCRLHMLPGGRLKGGHADDAFWIAKWGTSGMKMPKTEVH